MSKTKRNLVVLGGMLVLCLILLRLVVGLVKANPRKKWMIPVTIAAESFSVVAAGFILTGFWKED
ncbi:MAG: hypothetical protein HY400_04280 [Elusimicrobia bacterium]|nr:hypothetical protein [Elusimicrobiota bacterium]